MGIFDWMQRNRQPTLEEVRLQEKRLELREQRTLQRLEKIEKEREALFSQGAKERHPAKRRRLAQRYQSQSADLAMVERDLQMASKELSTLSALKIVLERRATQRDGISNLLRRFSETELATLLEDDKITTDLYIEKLDGVLNTLVDTPLSLSEELVGEGRDILKVWERMDEGEIDSFDEGIKLADGAIRKREAETEA